MVAQFIAQPSILLENYFCVYSLSSFAELPEDLFGIDL